MRTTRKDRRGHTPVQNSKEGYSSIPDVGLVLMDETLRVVGCDLGAAAILKFSSHANGSGRSIPAEILEAIRSRTRIGMPYSKMRFSTASGEYVCRSYLVESENGALSGRLVALHLERAAMGDLDRHAVFQNALLDGEWRICLPVVLGGIRERSAIGQARCTPSGESRHGRSGHPGHFGQ